MGVCVHGIGLAAHRITTQHLQLYQQRLFTVIVAREKSVLVLYYASVFLERFIKEAQQYKKRHQLGKAIRSFLLFLVLAESSAFKVWYHPADTGIFEGESRLWASIKLWTI